jgi:hypothetical protein
MISIVDQRVLVDEHGRPCFQSFLVHQVLVERRDATGVKAEIAVSPDSQPKNNTGQEAACIGR